MLPWDSTTKRRNKFIYCWKRSVDER